MTKGRLTKQELGWLLMQEAQGAAERLRTGVLTLKSYAPPAPDPGAIGVDATFEALDDAMRMLSSLHKQPVGGRGRRGRIDLAALLWEISPDVRVSMEPGSGTEVFGDESELRRTLHVLIGHAGNAGGTVTVRREGDSVRVSVPLGPDATPADDTERAWLSRMAIRYGGRYELDGQTATLVLPADGLDDRDENAALRKELDEARRQGEAYARELADVISQTDVLRPSSTFPPADPVGTPEELLLLCRLASGVSGSLRGLLLALGRDLGEMRAPMRSSPDLEKALRGESLDPIDGPRRKLMQAQEVVSQLAAFSELEPNETPAELDLVDIVKSAARALEPRAQRMGIRMVVGGDAVSLVRFGPRACQFVVKEVLAYALSASARDSQISVAVTSHGLRVDDTGPGLPAVVRRRYLALEVEAGTFGRPSAFSLFLASQVLRAMSGTLSLDDAPTGGLRTLLEFSR